MTKHEDMSGLLPDMALARRYYDTVGPPTKRVVLCAITGAHNYGFPSADSDIDIKGIHLATTQSLLGLTRPQESVDRTEIFEGVECDLTTNEAERALSLLLRGNGNMLERIFSPFQLFDTDAVAELRELAPSYLSRRFASHYFGFGHAVRREHLKADTPTAKRLLYTYRVALTGIHLMRTGEVVADVTVNGPRYGFDEVLDLVALKRQGAEKGAVPPGVDEAHRANWERLDAMLAEARDTSPLPLEPPGLEAVDQWLVRARLAVLGG